MARENKQLLLKDLSARLPYEVIVDIKYSKEAGSSDRLRICSEGYLVLNADLIGLFIEDEIYLKPYLRPMSSMTKEEEEEFNSDFGGISSGYNSIEVKRIDWLLKHHFDYRGLIAKDLAIKAPKGMYK